jgi:hypothetical protein
MTDLYTRGFYLQPGTFHDHFRTEWPFARDHETAKVHVQGSRTGMYSDAVPIDDSLYDLEDRLGDLTVVFKSPPILDGFKSLYLTVYNDDT